MTTNNSIITQEIDLSGRVLTLEVGRYAQQASGAVVARLGDTVVLATVVAGRENPDIDYLPLSVEYQEKLYSGGKIKGSRWVKREGRPSDEAILTARLIDRSLRPLFPKSLRREIQVVVTTLSVDSENDPDTPAIVAVSAALSLTDLPFAGPVGAVRVGFVPQNGTGNFLTNPTYQDREYSDLDLIVSGNRDGIVMVEAGVRELSEANTILAIRHGHAEIIKIIDAIAELRQKLGKKPAPVDLSENQEISALAKKIFKNFPRELQDLVNTMAAKEADADTAGLVDIISQKEALEDKNLVAAALDKAATMLVRQNILEKVLRPDGRKPDEIRPITCRVSELPRTHGSAMFQRGSTQALTITTLASPSMEQWIESPEHEEKKRYIHHYNMPPFSVGETGRMGWPSRREIGHGALAERALVPVIPAEKDFPYTIRVVSEIMSSNGSTSMASVCGSTLSLMDAGVPIKSPVAGIAMGLIIDGQKQVILSDIAGIEDFKGDMDFKVAGTTAGITALQMDVKVPGLSFDILETALEQARVGRLSILEKMLAVLPKSKLEVSKYAPKIVILQIDVEKIGDVIGPGGKTIKKIIAETEAEIDVEDDGTVVVSGIDHDKIQRAVDWIKGLTKEIKIGEEYDGTVVRITDFGAFVNLTPGKDGLVHISKLSTGYLSHPSEVISEGQNLKVRVENIDDQNRV
ncbi:MAG: Polyribonucleotide nucleotidyltransferase, partial [Candidatus Levybacteria bacterium GW2011_GWA2_37_36]